MVIYHGTLKVKPGKRGEYVERLVETGLEEKFRAQRGCVFYSLASSVTDPDVVVACDAWETAADFEAHLASPECKTWFDLHDEYVEADLRSDKFDF